jgi:IrrE N-terminal-like domain
MGAEVEGLDRVAETLEVSRELFVRHRCSGGRSDAFEERGETLILVNLDHLVEIGVRVMRVIALQPVLVGRLEASAFEDGADGQVILRGPLELAVNEVHGQPFGFHCNSSVMLMAPDTPSPWTQGSALPSLGVEDVHIGYCREVARSVAKRHGVTAPPVDVEAIAVREGMRVVRADLGALEGRMREDDHGWLIEVNSDRSLTSQRFSVGHELGHRKMGHHGCGTDAKQEREANLFAAELLIPLSLLRKAMAKHRSLGELARLFQVSKEAMQIKLQEQGMLLQLTSFD